MDRMINDDDIQNVQFLKRLDIAGRSYFFCPQTHVIFSLPPNQADAFEIEVDSNPARAYDKVKNIIAAKPKQINTPRQSPAVESRASLILTENCNLDCVYCWEHDGKSNKKMPLAIALKSIDFLMDFSEAHGIKNMILSFFGGEPLLNWEVIQPAILYAEARIKDKDARWIFKVTTNGTLFKPDMITFLADHHCQIVISIDGLPEAHDPYRHTFGRKPTHELVVKAIKKILAYMHPGLVTALMTLHHENLVHLPESVEFVRSLGIQRIGINPIRASGLPENSPLILTSEDYKQLATFLRNKYLEYPDLRTNPYSFPVRHRFLNRVNLDEQHSNRCEAGRNDFTVGVDGRLYPCGGFAFAKKMALGNVKTGIEKNLVEDYVEACGTVDDSPTCCSCWIRYFCGGGCYYDALSHQKDLREPFPEDCLHAKIMIEMALKAKIEFAAKYKVQNKK